MKYVIFKRKNIKIIIVGCFFAFSIFSNRIFGTSPNKCSVRKRQFSYRTELVFEFLK